MKKNYDLSKMKMIKNPYAKKLKKGVFLNLDPEAIEYFKKLSVKEGVPYQTLINSFLLDCAKKKKEMHVEWD